ncbi:hypothetical protein KOW79_006941 [Hemibagrus wyckioides]|uniref:Uncharacterized protein n=1 Tax=Hemibagrus wyckioides TaxID=337641 RepID=A0A9D3NUR1_9TELE|nr:hypothetical protein KOW79_006941 [Hemibagrus wyckioides]
MPGEKRHGSEFKRSALDGSEEQKDASRDHLEDSDSRSDINRDGRWGKGSFAVLSSMFTGKADFSPSDLDFISSINRMFCCSDNNSTVQRSAGENCDLRRYRSYRRSALDPEVLHTETLLQLRYGHQA